MNRYRRIWIALLAGSCGWIYSSYRDPLHDMLQIALGTAGDSEQVLAIETRLIQESSDRRTPRLNFQSEVRSSNSNQTAHAPVLKAFQEVVGSNWMATVHVLSNGRQVALGTIVDSAGWAITKSSELPTDSVQCLLFDGTRVESHVASRRNDLDLALLQLNRDSLPSVHWSTQEGLLVGSWLATTDLKKVPLAIGVLSVGARKIIRSPQVKLGVDLGDNTDGGALVQKVHPGTGAEKAGLLVGDLIVSIDGEKIATMSSAKDHIRTNRAGQHIAIGVMRGEKAIQVNAQLMDISDSLLLDPTEMEVNGSISARASGFSAAFQHDTVLVPNQCGGPVIDLQGNVAGINIARAGRVSTYALPASVVVPAVQEMMVEAQSITFKAARSSEMIVRGQNEEVKPSAQVPVKQR